jgi:indolepyruvate ferredoxin oxidoreductase
VKPRSELMSVQKMLRDTPGVTVLLYDQVCATEKRRRRKRGKMQGRPARVMINPLVCEGCGDCSKTSNCVSVEPLNTEFGRKRKINQSSCNQDYTCVDGFCPSFITLEGAENAHREAMPALTADSTPLPTFETLEGVKNIVFTGVGGTGVTTVASILAMAAHVDGRAASVVDMTGLAQKGGAVFSHVKIGETEETIVGGRVPAASANVLIACDLLVAANADALSLYAKDRTRGRQRRLRPHRRLRHRPRRALRRRRHRPAGQGGGEVFDAMPAHHLAETQLGDAIYGNMIMLGFAWQKGVIPISSRAIYRAIRLNGVDYENNLTAFELGRKAAHDPGLAASARTTSPRPRPCRWTS